MSESYGDVNAEQQVLATVLYQPKLADVLLTIPVEAFSAYSHQVIAQVVRDHAAQGEPFTAEMIAAEAPKMAGGGARGDAVRSALIQLVSLGNPGSLEFFADKVRHEYRARKVAETATRLSQMVGEGLEPEELSAAIDAAQESLEAHSSLNTGGEEPERISRILGERIEYDWLIPELLERTDRLLITAPEGMGKALAIDTPIATTDGWSTMGKLKVGDYVFAPDGSPVEVVAATDVMFDRPCYRVTFSDGAEIIADANHQWLTETLKSRETSAELRRRGPTKARGTDQRHKIRHRPAVVTTEQIRTTLRARGGHALNHSIATVSPLAFPERDLPIHPYVMGCWLGDGSSGSATFTSADQEIINEMRRCGETIRKAKAKYLWQFGDGNRRRPNAVKAQSMQGRLRALGVLGDKHIPEPYLTASADQRLALLQGLMDTDGTIDTRSTCEFSVCNERLAREVLELVWSLGIKATAHESAATLNGREVGRRWRIAFRTDLPVFRLPRKAIRNKPLTTQRAKMRYIKAVEPVASVPVRCIQVANTDGLFVAGRECITTHNSLLLAQFATCLAAGLHPLLFVPISDPVRVLVIDAENSRRQVARRYRRLIDSCEKYCARNEIEPPIWDETLGFLIQPEGVPFNDPMSLSLVENMIAFHKPDLVVAGPLYRLHSSDTKDEQAAKELVGLLDRLRVRYHFAFICETHMNHGTAGGSRPLRPTGSSVFMRWPEFGMGMQPSNGYEDMEHPTHMDVKFWRGGREERIWPRKLQHHIDFYWGPGDEHYYEEHQRLGFI